MPVGQVKKPWNLSELMIGDDQQHINRINWQIVLFNQQKVEVELSFRQPYSLHRDKADFLADFFFTLVGLAVLRHIRHLSKEA